LAAVTAVSNLLAEQSDLAVLVVVEVEILPKTELATLLKEPLVELAAYYCLVFHLAVVEGLMVVEEMPLLDNLAAVE
jgi:hypothetical protein